MKRIAIAVLMVLALATQANAQVIQDIVQVCTDFTGVNVASYPPAWGPGTCVPPAPYDVFGKPSAGWGSTPACTTGGSFSCNPGETYVQFTAGYGAGYAQSTAALVMNASTPQQDIPGLILNAFDVNSGKVLVKDPINGDHVNNTGYSAARSPITLTVDGGAQVNSALVNQFGIVDIYLFRDTAGGSPVQLLRRRVYSANSLAQFSLAQFSFTYVDRPPNGYYSYRVQAQWLAGTTSGTVVSGSATVVPHMRASLTASQSLP